MTEEEVEGHCRGSSGIPAVSWFGGRPANAGPAGAVPRRWRAARAPAPASIRTRGPATGRARAAAGTLPTMIDFTPNPVALDRSSRNPLVWDRLRRRHHRRRLARDSRGAQSRRADRHDHRRPDRDRRRRPDRRARLSRHRPVVHRTGLQRSPAADHPAAVQRPGHLRRAVHRAAGDDLAGAPLPGQLLALGRHHRARASCGPGRRPLGQLHEPGVIRPADQPAVGHRHRVPLPRSPVRLPGRHRPDRPARPTSSRSSSTSRC